MFKYHQHQCDLGEPHQVHTEREGHVGSHEAVEMLVHLLDPETKITIDNSINTPIVSIHQ